MAYSKMFTSAQETISFREPLLTNSSLCIYLGIDQFNDPNSSFISLIKIRYAKLTRRCPFLVSSPLPRTRFLLLLLYITLPLLGKGFEFGEG